MLLAHGFLKAIFEAFDRHESRWMSFPPPKSASRLRWIPTRPFPALAADLAKLADVKYEGARQSSAWSARICARRRGSPRSVFGELEDVKIRMISQGASEINLTFVIEEDDVPNVVQRLHRTFFSDLDPEVFA